MADKLEHDGVVVVAVEAEEFEVSAVLLEVSAQCFEQFVDLGLLFLGHVE